MVEDQSYNNPDVKKYSRILWGLAIAGLMLIFLLFFSLSRGDIPSFKDLENPEYNEASIIYDADGVPFGKYYVENRVPVQYEDISPYVLDALITTEDIRYYSHSGIDFIALSRVAFKTILLNQESSGGGSTITQQLAKLLFSRPDLSGNSFNRFLKLVNIKFREWITAVKIEKSYTKEEIIQMYLNKFEFVNGAYGIEAALSLIHI